MSRNTQNDAQQIADFIARNGITKIPQGNRAMASRDLYLAVRGELKERDPINERYVTLDSLGREYVKNGLGERIS